MVTSFLLFCFFGDQKTLYSVFGTNRSHTRVFFGVFGLQKRRAAFFSKKTKIRFGAVFGRFPFLDFVFFGRAIFAPPHQPFFRLSNSRKTNKHFEKTPDYKILPKRKTTMRKNRKKNALDVRSNSFQTSKTPDSCFQKRKTAKCRKPCEIHLIRAKSSTFLFHVRSKF